MMNRHGLDRRIKQVNSGSDLWRAIARTAPPWKVVVDGPTAVLWDTRDKRPVGTFDGNWAPGIARYLNAMEPRAGLALAELLWLIGGHGNLPSIQDQAHRLLIAMRIDTDLA